MRRIFVPLDDEVLCRLVRLAERERRHPSQQAALLLEMALLALAGGDQQTGHSAEGPQGQEGASCR